VKFSSIVSIQIFSVKNANPSFYTKCIENDYFPLPSKFKIGGSNGEGMAHNEQLEETHLQFMEPSF
jgi:hypothetical protein